MTRALTDEPAGPALPGTTKPKRFRPTFHYELLACGMTGHELVGTDAAELRPQASPNRRESKSIRGYRRDFRH